MVMGKILEMGKGQVEAWAQRGREAGVLQILTFALLREVGRQLSHALHAQRVGDDAADAGPGPSWHMPYQD